MYVKLAASILSMLLPLGLRAQTIGVLPDLYPSPGGVIVETVGADAGQRYMQREQQIEERRRQRELDRLAQLERVEQRHEVDRQKREIADQRRQLLQLQAKIDAQRAAIPQTQGTGTKERAEPRK